MFQFRRFPPYNYEFIIRSIPLPVSGFPHSEISGSKLICSSPQLIAACHVLHRLPVPRHSPCALSSLTFCLGLFWFLFLSKFFAWIKDSSLKTIVDESFDSYLIFCLLYHLFSCYSFFKVQWWVIPQKMRLVEMRRIELLTPCLQGRCSPSWATPPTDGDSMNPKN